MRRVLAVLAAGAHVALAEPVERRLDPVVVTAGRIPERLDRVSASTTVVPREEIEARQPATVLDVLERLPGLHVERAGGRGSVGSVFTRGGDPNHTLVLVDGVPVNDPTNTRGGSFDFSTLDVESIERIEVVRGPLSAVYGSDALAGVVNVVTIPPSREPAFAVHARGGRFGDHRVGAHARGPLGPVAVAASALYDDEGAPVEGDEFRTGVLTARAEAPVGERADVRLATRLATAQARAFPDDSGGPEYAVLRETDRRDVRELTAAATPTVALASWLTAEAQATYYDRTEDVRSPGVAPGRRDPFGIPPNVADTTFRRGTASASLLAAPWTPLAVTAGVEARLERGTSDGALRAGPTVVPTDFRLDRETWAPFVELRVAPLDALRLHAGVRADVPSDFAARASPRVGATYTVARTGTTLRATWGRGFKLPSFFALAHPIVGNPRLGPERGDAVDAGVVQALGASAEAGATFFASRTKGLIDLDEGPPPRLVNRSAVTARGVEVEAEMRPHARLALRAHVTYTATDIEGTGEELRNRPDWTGGATIRWRAREDLTLVLGAAWVGQVEDSSIPTGDVTLAPWGRVDLAVTWTATRHWSLSLAVDDLLDARYERAVGFRAPGPWVRVGLRYAS